MAVNNNLNLIQQICLASGLQDKELDALKVRLAKMSETELQAELTKAIAGNSLDVNIGLKVEKTTNQKISKEQETQLQSALQSRINAVITGLKKAEDSNGFLGSMWSGFKNLTRIGDSSNKVREQQKADIKALQSGNVKDAFHQITGLDFTLENVNKFLNNEIQTKSEVALKGYTEGQEMASDIAGDIISGIAAISIYTAAVAAAPFTSGASIAIGVAAATTSGALIKAGVKALDTVGTDRKYTLKDFGHDAVTGGFSGLIAPITGGMGGAAGKTVATKLGIQAVKQVGKEAAEEVVEQGVKQGLKTALTNPTGYEYVGGSLVKRGMAFATETATDGALGGAIDGGFRAGLDNDWNANAILSGTIEGGIGGAIMSPIIGGGMKIAGKGTQNVFGKNNVHIDANKNIIRTDVINSLLKNDIDIDYAAAVLRDLDDLETALKLAELNLSGSDKVRFNSIKKELVEKVNKNIAYHGSIVLQTEIPAERFKIDAKTEIRYAIAEQDDIVLAHAVQNNDAIESLTYLVNSTKNYDENNYLSLSLINKNSNLFGDETEGIDIYNEYGIIPKVRNKNITSAGFGQVSAYKKNFTTFVEQNSCKTLAEENLYLKNSFLKKMKERNYNLTDSDYVQLFNLLKNKQYFSEITNDIKINGITIKADILKDALEESSVELSAKFLYGNGSNNEVSAIIDGIKALYARVDNIDDVKPEILKLAKDNDLDVILLGKPTKLEITDPKYFEEIEKVKLKFQNKEISTTELIQQKRSLTNKYESIQKDKLRARTTFEKGLCVDKSTYLKLLTKDKITPDDIKELFPNNQLDKENFFMKSILETIPQIDPEKHIVDFNRPFDIKDYEIIANLFNLHNGRYKNMWLTKSKTDDISNIEKLACFARIIRSIKKVNLYSNFDEKIWDIIAKGIIEKPENVIKPLISYKINSNEINGALSKIVKMTPEIKEMIDEISKYIADSPIKDKIDVYRGETSYWIFGNEKTSEGLLIREEMLKHETSDSEIRNAFVTDVLMDIVFEYPRFLSTAFDIEDAETRAVKILWHFETPSNTKGIMIESYNIERESETEFLLQRNSEISIYDVIFNDDKKRWEIFAKILQRIPLTPLE